MSWITFRHYLHYIISAYIVFGGVTFNKNKNLLKLHIIILIGVLMHWYTNNGKCFLSEYDYNEENGDKEKYTKHLMDSIGISGIDPSIVSSLSVILPLGISVYFLQKLK